MPSDTKKITFSLPAELSDQLDEWTTHDQCTRSALIRRALARYLDDRQRWRETFEYGSQRAKELGIKPEDVPRLVEEVRAEMAEERRAGSVKARLSEVNSASG